MRELVLINRNFILGIEYIYINESKVRGRTTRDRLEETISEFNEMGLDKVTVVGMPLSPHNEKILKSYTNKGIKINFDYDK